MILYYFQRCGHLLSPSLVFLLIACTYPAKKTARIIEQEEKALQQEAIFLDVRPYFSYGTGHLIHAHWQDVQQYIKAQSLARMPQVLARKGIGLDSKVMVLGKAQQGKAEECLVALSLYNMGIKNVFIRKEQAIEGKRHMQEVHSTKKPSPYWQSQDAGIIVNALPAQVEAVDSQQYKWQNWLEKTSGRLILPRNAKMDKAFLPRNKKLYVQDSSGDFGGACVVLSMHKAGYDNFHYVMKTR